MNLSRRHLLAMSGAGLVAGLRSPALALGADPLVRIEGQAFATRWAVTLPAGSDAQALRPALEHMLAGIDRQMSPWRLDSEVTAFNLAPAGPRAVSPETALVARAALDTARASDGWFDPSVGPLVARWGFGPIDTAPDGVAHWQALDVLPDALVKTEAAVTLDLCGIAKGYALDRMAEIVAAAGHGDFLIDLGGELVGQGLHPEGRPWQVAVDNPLPGSTSPAGVLSLDGMAVATSGLKTQSFTLGDTTYSHIVDPHHLGPVQGTVASVSVLARDAMTADAWATALTAAGDAGPALARSAGIDALFLTPGADGPVPVTTGGFDRVMM